MLTLYTFAAGFGAFSYSPICTKAAYLLNMAGAQWQRSDMDDPQRIFCVPAARHPHIRVKQTA